MSQNDQPNSHPQQHSSATEERAIQESPWEVVRQGAQVFAEVGGGIGGIAAGVKVFGDRFGGAATGGSPPPPTQSTPQPSDDLEQE